MYVFKDPFRLDQSVSPDAALAEGENSILFAPPGPLKGSARTLDQFRDEHRRRDERPTHALALAEAGFSPGVRVVVVHDLDGGVERFVRVETAVPPPPSAGMGAEKDELGGEHLAFLDVPQGPEKGAPSAVSAAFEKKELEKEEVSTISEASPSKRPPQTLGHTFSGKRRVKDQPAQPRIRRRSEDIPWWERDFIDGHEVSHYIPKDRRKSALKSYLVAMALKGPLNLALDLNPNLDDLTPIERMMFLRKIPNNIYSYIQGRLDALKRPASYWPYHAILARESDQETHEQEHINGLIHVPCRDEMKRLIDRMEKQRGNPLLRNWCANSLAREVDDVEVWEGGKFHSSIGYVLKAADSHSTFNDSTILYEPSGAVLGERVFITRTLTKPGVVEANAKAVARHKRIRAEKRHVARFYSGSVAVAG